MTLALTRPAKCPNCGHDNHVASYDSINSHDRQLRERLVTGALWSWRCVKCAKDTVTIYPVLYHDMRAPCMIYYLDRRITEDPRVIEKMVPGADQLTALRRFNLNYRFRLCRSLDDFIEKIRIFDAGLDDRAVEYLKLRHQNGMKKAAPLASNAVEKMMVRVALEGRFERLAGEESRILDFGLSPFSSTPEERMVRTEVAYPAYADAVAKIRERLGTEPDVHSGFIVVDASYIEERFPEGRPTPPQPTPESKETAGDMGSVVFGKTKQLRGTQKPWWRFW
jgi:hypothetical protein